MKIHQLLKKDFWDKVSELLKMQKALDEKIWEEKGLSLSRFEMFELTRTAFIVELSEATNVAEFFKHWKDTRGNKADEGKTHEETLKEEFSDALHFILSMINQMTEGEELTREQQKYIDDSYSTGEDNEEHLNDLYKFKFEGSAKTALFIQVIDETLSLSIQWTTLDFLVFLYFIDYAKACGVTFDDLYKAYMIKNKINYERLESGY